MAGRVAGTMPPMARYRSRVLFLALTLWATPAFSYHPEPRVIVTVTALKGDHVRAAVLHAARESWGGIVRCYKQHGKRQRGTLELRLEISAAGKVVGTRRLGSTLNEDVSACLATVLGNQPMPAARSGSTATVEVELAPGDR